MVLLTGSLVKQFVANHCHEGLMHGFPQVFSINTVFGTVHVLRDPDSIALVRLAALSCVWHESEDQADQTLEAKRLGFA